MFIAIFSKLLAESLLSLYPTFVKNIGLPLGLQLWSRCFSYIAISAFFIDWIFIYKQLFSQNGLLLSAITAIHIYISYYGFQLLEGGIAYALFYTYPLMILLLSGEKIRYSIGFAILGVILIYMNNDTKPDTKPPNTKDDSTYRKNLGYIMILLAAFTEALIYFIVREIKTDNNWNHLFISYSIGALVTTAYYSQDIAKMIMNTNILNFSNHLSASLVINVFIGLFGYVLRFFAISRLSPAIYAPLSYFGIIMAVIYGYIFNGEIISIVQIIGIIFIVLGLLF
jgi:drug/metabolite transporter (DMT)-like permease